MPTNPTVVLVHGALTDASVWHGVIALLQHQGTTVFAPSLPMRSFDSDVAYLHSVLETLDGSLLVVAHSYAGSVVSAPDALTPAVQALVFVAAFQQDTGESAGGLNGQFPGSKLTPDNLVIRPYPGGNEVYVRPDRFAEIYAADVPADHAAVMAAAQHPFDASTLGGSFAGPPTWWTLPFWAIVSTADVSIPTEALRFMAQRAGSSTSEVDSSHAVPVSNPQAVAEVIRTAAASAAPVG